MCSDIHNAMRTLTDPNENWASAVDARQEIDLRIGAAFTRFQTQRIQKRFSIPYEGVISYGPCQFPTLGFVVERWQAREAFVPEQFWGIHLTYRAETTDAPADDEQKGEEKTRGGHGGRGNRGGNTNGMVYVAYPYNHHRLW